MMELNDYLTRVAAFAAEMEPMVEGPIEVASARYRSDATERQCIDFRRTMLVDRNLVGSLVDELGFFDGLDRERGLAGWAFGLDITDPTESLR
jgi:hypothetical protein